MCTALANITAIVMLETLRMPADTTYLLCMQQLAYKMELAKRAAAARDAKKAASRRNQSKLNQRRYRAERKRSTSRLEREIDSLHLDVARMEGCMVALRLAVPAALRTFAPEFQVANENYRLFAQGYCLDPASERHQAQVGYLNSVMSEDLVMMGSIGRDKLFAQWTVYAQSFDSISMELLRLHAVSFSPDIVLHAETMMHMRMSRVSIQVLFPHVLNNEPLVQRLIGKVLHLPMQMRFVFDQHGMVQELGTHANTTEALVNLLGSVEDTLAVLGDFQLSEDAEIVAQPATPPPPSMNQI